MTADGVLLKDGIVPITAYPDALLLSGERSMTGKFQAKDAKCTLPHTSIDVQEAKIGAYYYPCIVPLDSAGGSIVVIGAGVYTYDPLVHAPVLICYASVAGALDPTRYAFMMYDYTNLYGFGDAMVIKTTGHIVLDPSGIVKVTKDVLIADNKFIDLGNAAAGLPAAAAAHRGKLGFSEGGAGARDRVYSCMKSDAGAYNWIEIANGGA